MGAINLTIGLCDDHECIHETVETLLHKYEENKGITIQLIHYDCAKQLLQNEDKLDVLLLDIEMPEMDGIEAGCKLREQNAEYKIIMLTAREDRIKEAFKIEAFRFVSKPIDEQELYKAIDDVIERTIKMNSITVYRDGILYEILEKDIFYIEAYHAATLIFTGKSEFRSEYSLAKWNEILDDRIFFQCHKSYIVNLSKIGEINKDAICLINEEKVPVSRRLRTPFLNAYMLYDTKWR